MTQTTTDNTISIHFAPDYDEDEIDRVAYKWDCDTCHDQATSGWAECPDCGNPHKVSHP